MAVTATLPGAVGEKKLEKKPIKFSNLLLGAGLNLFEVTTLGQPLEVVKTTMAANRGDGVSSALARVWSRGGVLGCRLHQLARLCRRMFFSSRTTHLLYHASSC